MSPLCSSSKSRGGRNPFYAGLDSPGLVNTQVEEQSIGVSFCIFFKSIVRVDISLYVDYVFECLGENRFTYLMLGKNKNLTN